MSIYNPLIQSLKPVSLSITPTVAPSAPAATPAANPTVTQNGQPTVALGSNSNLIFNTQLNNLDSVGPSADDITITITDQNGSIDCSGFQSVEIICGIEEFPRSFTIVTTEKFPDDASQIEFLPGCSCVVKVGGVPIITGNVDRVEPEFAAPDTHIVTIAGRNKTCDLVDCSALVNADGSVPTATTQISGLNILQIAQALCAPYNIQLTATSNTDTITYPIIPNFVINLGQTPYDVLEIAASYNAVLIYDNPDGSLVIGPVGTKFHTGTIGTDILIQSGRAVYDMSNRYSTYVPVLYSQVTDVANDTVGAAITPGSKFPNGAQGVSRFRPLIIQNESATISDGQITSVAEAVATYEANRRFGRSQIITVTVTTWRDTSNNLFTPNQLVTITSPNLKLNNNVLLISKVTFRKDVNSGTTAELELMAPAAFAIQPPTIAGQLDIMQQLNPSTGQTS
jgi:prophage tail gpP-like protein